MEVFMKKQKTTIAPIAFRFRPQEREALRALARRWNTKQIEVIRRLLTQALERENGNGNQ
jgi:hypothetical protein